MDYKLLLGDLCEKSLIKQYKLEMQACKENDRCSSEHYAKVSEILGFKVKYQRKLSKRMCAIIIAAALLLLTACTAYIFREQIKGLIIEKFEDCNKVIDGAEKYTNSPEEMYIKEPYYLTYIPDGYELKEEKIFEKRVYYKWENDEGDVISYSQTMTTHSGWVDNKDSNIIQHEPYEIHYSITNEYHCYFWCDGKYYNLLRTSNEIIEEELSKIIEGIINTRN